MLDAVRFERTRPDAAADDHWVTRGADRVEGLMQGALTRLAEEREGPPGR